VTGDVRHMHKSPENAGALFQVASQFNTLEMTGPEVTPEHGVTIYQYDGTQGPACAIAAGAATIYRNYFAPIGGSEGQTKDRQYDGLADLGKVLSSALNQPVGTLWRMCSGYALCTGAGLDDFGAPCKVFNQISSIFCVVSLASACTAMWKSRKLGKNTGPSSRKLFARLCRWLTPACHPRNGSHSRLWFWRQPTKPRCSRLFGISSVADRTLCS